MSFLSYQKRSYSKVGISFIMLLFTIFWYCIQTACLELNIFTSYIIKKTAPQNRSKNAYWTVYLKTTIEIRDPVMWVRSIAYRKLIFIKNTLLWSHSLFFSHCFGYRNNSSSDNFCLLLLNELLVSAVKQRTGVFTHRTALWH